MAFPIVPVAIAVAGIALAWWAGKSKDDSPASLSEVEDDEIIDAVAELLPYKGEVAAPLAKANVLSQIASAINKTGATGMKDFKTVMTELNQSNVQESVFSRKVSIMLLAQEYLEWLEKNPQNVPPALSYVTDSGNKANASRQPATATSIEIDDVVASIKAWDSSQQQRISQYLPGRIAKNCGCTKADGTPKTPFSKAKAERIAARYKQRMYECENKPGFYHLTSK